MDDLIKKVESAITESLDKKQYYDTKVLTESLENLERISHMRNIVGDIKDIASIMKQDPFSPRSRTN